MTARPQHDEDVHELLERGRNLRGSRRPAGSLQILLRAVRLAPNNEEAWTELQTTNDQIHQLFDLVSCYKQELADNPTDRQALLDMAKVLTQLERDEEAARALERAVVADPEDWETLFTLGILLNNNGQFEAALTVFDRLIALEPEWAEPVACKGMILCNLHRYVDALLVLDRAVELDQGSVLGWTETVRALYCLGREEEARAAYRHERAARIASGVPAWMPRDADPDDTEKEDGNLP